MALTLVTQQKKTRTLHPALTFAWMLWKRNTAGLIVFAAYWLGLSITVHITTLSGDATFFGMLLLAVTAIPVLGSVILSDTDPGLTTIGYPTHLFRLPLSSAALALYPMAFGIVLPLAIWSGIERTLLAPLGHPVTAVWPGWMLAATILWLQAVCWAPLAFSKWVSVVLVLAADAAFAIYDVVTPLHPDLMFSVYAVAAVLAVPVGCAAVTYSRRGDQVHGFWEKLTDRIKDKLASPQPAFASAQSAQSWYEWRTAGVILPTITVSLLLLSLLLYLAPGPVMAAPLVIPVFTDLWSIQVSAWQFTVPSILLMTPLLLQMLPILGGTQTGSGKDCQLASFYARQPLTEGALIAAKLRLGAGVIGYHCVTFLGTLLLWLLLPAQEGPRHAPLGLLLVHHLTPNLCLTALGLIFVATVLLFKLYADVLPVWMCGRYWVVILYFGVAGIFAYGKVLTVYVPYLWHLLLAAPWVLFVLLAIKAALSVHVLRLSRQRELISAAALPRIVLLWGAGALCTVLAAQCVLPQFHAYLWLRIGLALLLLPGVRLSLAPLALHWNRHR